MREIRDLVDPEFWGYRNTKKNPADISSKGCKASELVSNDLCWKGPQFLKESDEMWYSNQLNKRTSRERIKKKFEIYNKCSH